MRTELATGLLRRKLLPKPTDTPDTTPCAKSHTLPFVFSQKAVSLGDGSRLRMVLVGGAF